MVSPPWQYYCSLCFVQEYLAKKLMTVVPHPLYSIHHDSTTTCSALTVQEYLVRKPRDSWAPILFTPSTMTILPLTLLRLCGHGPHPLYYSDLALCKIFVSKTKVGIQREKIWWCYHNQRKLAELNARDFHTCFWQWQNHWTRYSKSQGNCFKERAWNSCWM
jgi:hypothetical protein